MTPEEIQAALFEPFEIAEVKWKPQAVKGNRALAIAYVDARVVMDRLDKVLGIGNWQDDYEVLADGSTLCRLRVRIGGEWLVKVDVGSQSEQPDEGDRDKAAVSDALKRAAVKIGIGRYLYRLPSSWVDFDPQTKRIVKPPQLPPWAIPKAKPQQQTPPDPPKQQPPAKPPPANGNAKPPPPAKNSPGVEFANRLAATDASMVREGLCQPGELIAHVKSEGAKRFLDGDCTKWDEASRLLGQTLAKRFREERMANRQLGRVPERVPTRNLDEEADDAMAADVDPYEGE